MHTTTVRFCPAHWREIQAVCKRDGIAAAQYIREATIARMAREAETVTGRRLGEEVAELRERVERVERLIVQASRRR